MLSFRNFLDKNDLKVLKKIFFTKQVLATLIVFSLIIWLTDSLIDYLFYFNQSEGFLNILLLDIPAHGLYGRFTFILIFISFSFLFSLGYTKKYRSERREKFLNSLLTHDLRNHCQIILGYLEILKNSPNTEKKDIEKIDKSIESTNELLSLTDKVRTWVNALKGCDDIELSIKELKKKIDSSIEKAKNKKKDFNIELIDRIEDEKEFHVVSPPLIEEIIYNLLENCCHHSNCEKTKIKLTEEKEILIIVEDDGKGIPKEDWERVFDLEYSKKPSSGGIGLYLDKKILNTCGGNISISKSSLGGSRFEIKLKKQK